eukprot:8729534-Pyramimonas_sp.AAC.1
MDIAVLLDGCKESGLHSATAALTLLRVLEAIISVCDRHDVMHFALRLYVRACRATARTNAAAVDYMSGSSRQQALADCMAANPMLRACAAGLADGKMQA